MSALVKPSAADQGVTDTNYIAGCSKLITRNSHTRPDDFERQCAKEDAHYACFVGAVVIGVLLIACAVTGVFG